MRISLRVFQLAFLLILPPMIIALMDRNSGTAAPFAMIPPLIILLSAYLPKERGKPGWLHLTVPEQFLVIFSLGFFGREMGIGFACFGIGICMPLALFSAYLRGTARAPDPPRSIDLMVALASLAAVSYTLVWVGLKIIEV